MNAKDLMIGDLVYYSEPNQYLTRVDEIRQTADNQPLYYIAGKRDHKDPIQVEDVNLFACDILFPIPLTPEILEKNGYNTTPVYDIDDDSIVYPHIDLCGEWTWYNGKIYYGITDEEVAVLFDCKYVHEFQHFLRLVGIKKEIVL